jgi:hypothetical protein
MKIVGRFAFLQAALLLTFVAVFGALAHSQQDVAPEHFDAQSVAHAKGKQTAHAKSWRARQDADAFKTTPGARQGNTSTPRKQMGKQKVPVRPTVTAQATTTK